MNNIPHLLLVKHAVSHEYSRKIEGETNLVVGQLDSRNHDNSTVSRIPIIVANERALGSGTFSRAEFRHSEPNVRMGVHRVGVENRDSVPARLNLNGEMTLESMAGFEIAEDGFEGCVLEGGSVHISSYPTKSQNVSRCFELMQRLRTCRKRLAVPVAYLGVSTSQDEEEGRMDERFRRGRYNRNRK